MLFYLCIDLLALIFDWVFVHYFTAPIYANSLFLTLPIFAISSFSFLAVILIFGERRLLKYMELILMPTAFTFSVIDNLYYTIAVVVFSLVICTLLSLRKSQTEFIDFTDDGELFSTKTFEYPSIRKALVRSVVTMSVGLVILLSAMNVFTSPTKTWLVKAYPVDYTQKGDYRAVASGDVTIATWDNPQALLVNSFYDINSELSPCVVLGMQAGDVITEINGQAAAESDFIKNGATEAPITLTVLRTQSEEISVHEYDVTPVFSEADNSYRIGLTYYNGARLGTSVQTMSFVLENEKYFAATGHSSSAQLMKYTDEGHLYYATATGRDDSGLTAELTGDGGMVEYSDQYGSYGYLNDYYDGESVEIAQKKDVRRGKATLLSGLDGSVKEYDVYISGTFRISGRDVLTLLADDERLVSFGGVARGMSGSPILQNGKLIGVLSNMDAGGYSAYATYAIDMAENLRGYYNG